MATGRTTLDPKKFFSKEEIEAITLRIGEIEKQTSGEIRIKVIRDCPPDTRKHAESEFVQEGLTRTRDATGVLLLLILRKRKFEILADRGINEKISRETWQEISGAISSSFREEKYLEGVLTALDRMGAILAEHFPRKDDDVNELPDAPILG
ncbi:MAG: TPM domain-containing protein [Armatimonadetes bacterium]|nr:TPM domain-containing protein [Armatimonadota bacterium]